MIYALFLALLLTVVIATNLSDHFVTFSGARTVGGCDADKDKLQNTYKEAHKLVDNALKSLNSLGKRRPDFSADDVSLSDSDKKDMQECDRQARLLKALLAVHATPEKGVSTSESQSRLQNIIPKSLKIPPKCIA